jgi:hypothetical protein
VAVDVLGFKTDDHTRAYGADWRNAIACPDDFECETGENCQSLIYWQGKHQAPKRNDGRHNGDETGIDCGAPCNNSCP